MTPRGLVPGLFTGGAATSDARSRDSRDQCSQLTNVFCSGKLVSCRELVQGRGVRVDITRLEPTYLSLTQTSDLPLLEPLALSERLDRFGVVLRLPSEACLVLCEDFGIGELAKRFEVQVDVFVWPS
jgi:hypothetical protein